MGNYEEDGELVLMRCSHGQQLIDLSKDVNQTQCGAVLYILCGKEIATVAYYITSNKKIS